MRTLSPPDLACRPSSLLLYILLTAMIIICTGCSNSDPQERGKNSYTKVTYRLKWLLNASAAGDIWAKKAGFFNKSGIEVNIREGGAEQDAITDILMGRATFGAASADQVIRAVSRGADIVVAAQIFQTNPLQWIFFADETRPVRTPEDLKGLTVGITYGGNDEAIFSAIMKKYGLTENDLTLYAVHYDYAPFWKKKVNLWPVYRNTEGIILEDRMAAQGHKAAFLNPSRFGVNFVANSIVTSRHTWQTKPELVKRFVLALSAAWHHALDAKNITAAAKAVHQYDNDTPVETIIRQLRSTRRFVLPQDTTAGRIDVEAWRQTADIMLTQGLIDKALHVENLLITDIISPDNEP